MTEFAFLLIVSLTLFARSAIRLMRERFVHPADLATVSTVYYSVPLAVAGYFSYNPNGVVFLHGYAADPFIAVESLRFVALAVVSLTAGAWMGQTLPKPRLRLAFYISRDSWIRATVAYGGLISMVFLGILFFGLSDFLAGYAIESFADAASLGAALVYFATGSLGLVFAYTILINRIKDHKPLYALMFTALLVVGFVLIVRSKRLEIVSALLPAIVLLLSTRSVWARPSGRLAMAFALIAGLVAISFYRIEDDVSLFTTTFYALSEGLYAGHSLPGIIANIDMNTLGYENGSRFLNSLLGIVPRFLWEGKDDMVYVGNVVLESVSPLGATNLLAEVVLQGGSVAVVICYSLMGVIFASLMQFEAGWDRGFVTGHVPFRFWGYVIAVAVFIPHFRDGIIPAIKLSLQAGAFVLVAFGARPMLMARSAKGDADGVGELGVLRHGELG